MAFRNRLVFLFLLVMALSGLSTLTWSWVSYRQTKHETEQMITKAREQAAVPLNGLFRDVDNGIEYLASLNIFTGGEGDKDKELDSAQEFFAAMHGSRLMAEAFDPEGRKMGEGSVFSEGVPRVMLQALEKAGGKSGPVLSVPFELGGAWFAAALMAVRNGDGTKAGTVAIVFSVDEILDWWRMLQLPRGSAIAMLSPEGILWLRLPFEPGLTGKKVLDGPLMKVIRESNATQGLTRIVPINTDLVERYVGWRNLDYFGFRVALGLSSDYMAEQWKDKYIMPLAVVGAVTVLALIVLFFVSRSIHLETLERKKAEKALRESEKRFAKVFESSPALIAITNIDNGQYFDVNDVWLNDLGYTRREVLGRTSFDLNLWADLSDRERLVESLKKSLSVRGLETRLRTKAGEIRDFLLAIEPIELDGKTRLLSVAQDITRRKKNEKVITRLGRIVEDSMNEVFVFDVKTLRFLQANYGARKNLGYTMEDLSKLSAFDIKPEFTQEQFEELIEPLRSGELDRLSFATIHRRKDGSTYDVNVRLEIVRTEQPPVFIAIIEDITEQKRAERALYKAHEELELRVEERTRHLQQEITERKYVESALQDAKEEADRANRTKSDFLAGMSHELRTPLNAIIGFTDSIRHETFGPLGNEKYLDYLDNIHASGVHLLELINDILDVSAIEADKLDLNEEEFDIAETIGNCRDLILPRAQQAGVVVKGEVPPGLPKLCADRRRVRQILLNLLSNSVKFTPDGGTVTTLVRMESDGSMAIIVTDTGIGMTDEEIPKALEPFTRIDNPETASKEGTGLGLGLCRNLTESHGGSLEIESIKGYGTAVTVRFPAIRVVKPSP